MLNDDGVATNDKDEEQQHLQDHHKPAEGEYMAVPVTAWHDTCWVHSWTFRLRSGTPRKCVGMLSIQVLWSRKTAHAGQGSATQYGAHQFAMVFAGSISAVDHAAAGPARIGLQQQ